MSNLFDEPSRVPDSDATPANDEAQAEWVPNLAERLETIERANMAIERARVLLERVNQLENRPAPADDE